MKKTLLAATAALALTLAVPAAHAQWVVYDPTDFSQNVLIAARSLQQINNQIQSFQNEAQMILNQGQMLVNQGKNLASLAYSPMAMLQQDIARTNALISQAQGLATQVGQLNQQFSQQYPSGYGANTSLDQTVADARTRWNNSLAVLHTTLDMQAQVNASITADQGTLSQIVGSSQGAAGILQAAHILQATQATNQLLALLAKQTMQSQQLRIAQDRAAALEQSRALEADAQAQANRTRFMGSPCSASASSAPASLPVSSAACRSSARARPSARLRPAPASSPWAAQARSPLAVSPGARPWADCAARPPKLAAHLPALPRVRPPQADPVRPAPALGWRTWPAPGPVPRAIASARLPVVPGPAVRPGREAVPKATGVVRAAPKPRPAGAQLAPGRHDPARRRNGRPYPEVG